MQPAANLIPPEERKGFCLNGQVVAVVELVLVFSALAAIFSVATFNLAGSAAQVEFASVRGATLGPVPGLIVLILAIVLLRGFRIVRSDQALILFSGRKYVGTIRGGGLIWTSPFLGRRKISLQSQTLTLREKASHPVQSKNLLSATLHWKVRDTAKAMFATEHGAAAIQKETTDLLHETAARLSDRPRSSDIASFRRQLESKLEPLGIDVQSAELRFEPAS